ncbi:MAG TPA: ABC transporter permease subunit, partial [Limnochordia bacterium]
MNRVVYLLYAAILAFFAVFLVYPLVYLVKAGLWLDGRFDPIFVQLVWINPISRSHLWNSLLLGLWTVVFSSAVAIPLAFLTVRYRFWGQQLFQGLILISIVLPPFVSAIGIKQLFAQYGALTLLLDRLGLAEGPVDWLGGGFGSVVFLEALHLYPILYLNVAAALANIDPAQEEAALAAGAPPRRVLRTITLPLLAPGYFAGAIIVFVWAFTDLGVPLILHFDGVLPMRIFNALQDIYVNPIGYAMVLWVLVIALAAFFA